MNTKNLSWSQEGIKIHAQAWLANHPKAIVCIIHGFAEHGGRYARVADFLNKQDISVFAIDQFGHGQTEGKRGFSPSYESSLDSVEHLIEEARKLQPNLPVFIWGHSMGGNVVINYVLRRQPNIKGAIATAPWLKLGFEPPKFKIVLAKIMRNIYPAFPEKADLDTNALSRDAAEVKNYIEDPLVHNQATAGTFLETFEAGYWALENAGKLNTPLLVMHGTDDKLISYEGSVSFAQKSPKHLIKFVSYRGFYHELHNEPEPDRTKVMTDITEWINGQLNR
jgi:acylglycerol lipase